jgi:type III secretory pathway component EscR
MKKTLSTLLLSTVLMAPVAVRAMDDHDRDRDAQGRYSDPAFRDYHEWNDHEEHAYREYLKERHRENKEWAKNDKKEQEAYWKWRHKHPDAAIFHDEH